MSVTALEYLFRVEAPYVSVGPGEEARKQWNPGSFYSAPGIDTCVKRLRGHKMRTTRALMDEFGAVLQLFDGFGENWYALEECLSYLDEWMPADAYVLTVERAEDLLVEDPSDLTALLMTVDAAADLWAKPVSGNERFNRGPVPFHVLLNLSGRAESPDGEARIRAAAIEAGVELR